MLNELYELSRALDHHGLLQSTTHPNVRNVGKGNCLLFELDKSGNPRGIRLLSSEETANLWKHSKGNHNNFPAIRVQKPILNAGESRKIDSIQWKKAEIREKIGMLMSLDFHAINPECTDIKITDWSVEELSPVLESDDARLAALKQLLQVFPRAEQCREFLEMLTHFLKQQIAASDNEPELDFIKELLVGSLDNRSGKYVAGCMTYYDVYEMEDFPNLIASSETGKALISLLNQAESTFGEKQTIVSPFTGTPTDGIGDKYPNPNLPLLGLTYLYSKKSDTPCLTRYTMTGTEAFQAGKREVHAMNDAIAFLTASSRKNKTWAPISDSNREKPNLLLAYLTDDPLNDAYLAKVLGALADFDDEESNSEQVELVFESLCQQVLDNLRGIIEHNPNSKVNLIVLETLDPGRKQVVYENFWTTGQFQKNLLSWAEAAKNHPPIEIRIRENKRVIPLKPFCPGPDEICQLLKIHYTRSGSSRVMKQSSVTMHDIYQLYMPQNERVAQNPDLLNRMLNLVVDKSIGLLGDVKQQMIFEYALPSTKEAKTSAKWAAMFVSLISILLWRLGVRKEDYMLDAAFNVGQFLQLADLLHKQYCIQVRNGGDETKPLPTQLMGNELLAIASENPVEALNRLRDRMRIYLAWANTATGEGSGLPKWILARFAEVSEKIAAKELPEQFTPAQQAQVLLGYLAAIPYEKNDGGKKE